MCNVHYPIAKIGKNGVILASDVVNTLLKMLPVFKALGPPYGYLVAVTEVISLGQGFHDKRSSKCITFPVEFVCRTLRPVDGEVMTGVVHGVTSLGVFLRYGPMNMIFLSPSKMTGYLYQEGDKQVYLREDMSRIEVGVVVRFSVLHVKFVVEREEYHVLATIDGDGLGPVSHNGTDDLDL